MHNLQHEELEDKRELPLSQNDLQNVQCVQSKISIPLKGLVQMRNFYYRVQLKSSKLTAINSHNATLTTNGSSTNPKKHKNAIFQPPVGGKMSKNCPNFMEAIWRYEAMLLLCDAPTSLKSLLENGNYYALRTMTLAHLDPSPQKRNIARKQNPGSDDSNNAGVVHSDRSPNPIVVSSAGSSSSSGVSTTPFISSQCIDPRNASFHNEVVNTPQPSYDVISDPMPQSASWMATSLWQNSSSDSVSTVKQDMSSIIGCNVVNVDLTKHLYSGSVYCVGSSSSDHSYHTPANNTMSLLHGTEDYEYEHSMNDGMDDMEGDLDSNNEDDNDTDSVEESTIGAADMLETLLSALQASPPPPMIHPYQSNSTMMATMSPEYYDLGSPISQASIDDNMRDRVILETIPAPVLSPMVSNYPDAAITNSAVENKDKHEGQVLDEHQSEDDEPINPSEAFYFFTNPFEYFLLLGRWIAYFIEYTQDELSSLAVRKYNPESRKQRLDIELAQLRRTAQVSV